MSERRWVRVFYKGQFGFKIVPVAITGGYSAVRVDYSGEGNHVQLRRWGRRGPR